MKSFIKSVFNTKILFLCVCTTSNIKEAILENSIVKNSLESFYYFAKIITNSCSQMFGKEYVVPMKFSHLQFENKKLHVIYSGHFISSLSKNVAFYVEDNELFMSLVLPLPNQSNDGKTMQLYGKYFIKLNNGNIGNDVYINDDNGQEHLISGMHVSSNNNKEIVITSHVNASYKELNGMIQKIKHFESLPDGEAKNVAQMDLEKNIIKSFEFIRNSDGSAENFFFDVLSRYYYINVVLMMLTLITIISFISYSVFNHIKAKKLPQRISEAIQKGIKVSGGYSEAVITEYVTNSQHFNTYFKYLTINNNGLSMVFKVEDENISEKNLNLAMIEMIPSAQNEIKFLENNNILHISYIKLLAKGIDKYIKVLEPSSSKLKIKEQYFSISKKNKHIIVSERFTKSAKVILTVFGVMILTLVGFVVKHVASSTSNNEEFDEE